MGLFSKKGLEQLKKDFPLVKQEVGSIVIDAALKGGVKYSNAASTTNAMFEVIAAQLKSQLGYKLSVNEVIEFLNSPQFLQGADDNKVAGKLADLMFGK